MIMNKYPKISIVTSSYNQANYLEHTIKSILDQQYPNLEYIIIDGGSTDGSVDIIKKYSQHIAYWVSEKDNGVCDGINKGFQHATGEIMGCINSDDMLHKNSLFTVAEIFSNYAQINWLLGATTIFDEVGRTVYVSQSQRFNLFQYFLGEFSWIQLESTFWRRSLWVSAGGFFSCEFKYACDFDLWVRFFKLERLFITDALIGGFRMRSQKQLSSDNFKHYMDEVKLVLARYKWDHESKQALRRVKALRGLQHILRKSKVLHLRPIKDRLDKHINTLTNVPPKLVFDKKSQTYQLGN